MSEFGGLRKRENTQHGLVALGSAALAAAVALLNQVRQPEFPKRDNEMYRNKIYKNIKRETYLNAKFATTNARLLATLITTNTSTQEDTQKIMYKETESTLPVFFVHIKAEESCRLSPLHHTTFFFLFLFTLCCPNGNFSHGKFGSLSPRKASCNRVALPNPN